MSETITQINTFKDGSTTIGEYPDAAIQASIETQNEWRRSAETDFQAVVDSANLNDQYTNSLTLANKYFANQGLVPAPMRVISRETMDRAYSTAGMKVEEDTSEADGRYINGRVLVIENQEMIEMFGDDDVLGLALHEAAHSLGGEKHVIRTVEEQDRRIALGGTAIGVGSLIKADLRKDSETTMVGNFWEEAFADLTRVRALRTLEHTHDIESTTSTFEHGDVAMMWVPNGSDIEKAGVISLPAEFAAQSKTISGKNLVAHSAPNYAAYALELLDNRVPGLYDDLVAARQDPANQRGAIQKIESVQPGLYKQLRELEYSNEDFAAGLRLVLEALGDGGAEQKETDGK